MLLRSVFLLLLLVVAAAPSRADDGYRLWLECDRITNTVDNQCYA